MRKRIVVVVALSVLVALSSAYAQTTDFFNLIATGTSQQIQAAIDQGADLKALDPKYSMTPLMYAATFSQNPEVIAVLLTAGADLKAQNKDGMTALMYAAEHNANPGVITMLLKAGADGKAKDRQGNTAYDYAQKNAKLKGTDAYRLLNEAQY